VFLLLNKTFSEHFSVITEITTGLQCEGIGAKANYDFDDDFEICLLLTA